jgi:hypothetical protein
MKVGLQPIEEGRNPLLYFFCVWWYNIDVGKLMGTNI